MEKRYIGIDLGGTKIAVGVTDGEYRIIGRASAPTRAERSPDEITADMARLCTEAAGNAGCSMDDIAHIGIVSPGAIDIEKGVIEYACNLPFRSYDIVRTLSSQTGGKTVFLENDANAAALGEAAAGAARGSSSSVMVTLGTGVGGGVITDGHILHGCNGAAAELGHMVIEHGGVLCPCGRQGCFEAYCSATALRRMTAEAMDRELAAGRMTDIYNLCAGNRDAINAKTAFDAMRLGDRTGSQVVDTFISYLACGITNLINAFQPEVLIIGGGVSREGHFILDPLTPIVEREQYTRSYKIKTAIKIAQLGNDAGIVGAAALGNA